MGNSTKPTLRSRATARVLDVISEGPIWGLLDGDKSVYLNGTRLQATGGGYQFSGVRTKERKGTPTQDPIPGFGRVENEINDGRQIQAGSPITFDIVDSDIDAVRLKIRVNSLFENTDKGKMKQTRVQLKVDIRPNLGAYTEVGTVNIYGRTTSNYDRQKRIELPAGGHPYSVRIRRITNNSSDPNLANDTYLPSYTVITDWRLRYTHTACIGVEVDAKRFGQTFPERIYEVGGRKIDYPSNYNPNTRVYSGVWNGTFTSGERCDSPAWVIWDLATIGRYGLGNALKAAGIDKWVLYQIAQYCDGMVPDGKGGTEPRFTFNGVINTREDAAKLLDRLCAVFRGMVYWSSGSITFTQDAPATTIAAQVTRANTLRPYFRYSGAGRKARHSQVVVSWNDPDKLGEVNFEYVSRSHLILKYGYRPIEVAAMGCTSVAQARRIGEALLDTEEFETTMVTYRASFDHANVRPGNIVEVYDPWWAGARMGGRVLSATTTSLTIDAPVTITPGLNWFVRVTMPDGTIEERDLTNGAGSTSVLTFVSALPTVPVTGAVYGMANDDVNPRLYRVVNGNKIEDNIFEINAVFHDPTKYDRIERSLTLTAPSYSVFDTERLAAPTGLTIVETRSDNGDEYAASAVLSWRPSIDHRVTQYGLQIYDGDDPGYQEEIIVEGTSFSYDECPIGDLKFRVRSLGTDDRYNPSDYVESSVTAIIGYPAPTAYTTFTAVGKFREIVLKFAENTDVKFRRTRIWASQTNNVATATIVGYDRDTKFIHKDLGKKETWYYWIDAQDKYGRNSAKYPATTSGIAATTVPITDDDTTDDAYAAPTNLTLAKVQDNDEDGPVKTFIYMTCTPPGWVTAGKTKYEWEVTVDGRTVIKKSGSATYNWRVHKIGQQHDVRVRAVQGSGKEGDWSGTQSITPTKKTNNVPTPTGLDANAKPNGNRLKLDDPSIKDLKWVLFYSHTSNSSGSATLVEKRHALKWRDDDPPGTKGDTSYYWARFVDKSDNIGSFSSVATCVNRGVDDGDTDNTSLASPTSLSLSKVQDRDDDGTMRTFVKATWNAPGWFTGNSHYEIEITVGGETYIEKSGDTKHRVRVQVTGQQYDIRVRGVKGVSNRGNWTGTQSLTPTKKAAGSVPAVGSITITTTKKAEITIDWVDVDEDTYKDWHRTWIYRNTTGSTPTIGVTSVYKKLTQGQYTDKKTTTGVTYYYWVVHKDRSGNFSGLAGPAAGTSGGNEVSTFADLSGYIASAQINSNTIVTSQVVSGNVTTGLLATNAASNSVSVYNAPQVLIGIIGYTSIASITLDITDFVEYQIGISFVNTGTIDRVYTMRVYRGATLILQKGFTVTAANQFGSFVFISSGGSGSTTFDFQLITTSSNEFVADRAAFVYGRKR